MRAKDFQKCESCPTPIGPGDTIRKVQGGVVHQSCSRVAENREKYQKKDEDDE